MAPTRCDSHFRRCLLGQNHDAVMFSSHLRPLGMWYSLGRRRGVVIRTEAPRTMQTLIFFLGLPTLSEAGLICPMQVLHLINSTHTCRRALVLHRRMWTGQQLLNKTALKALRLTHAQALGFWGFPKVKKHGFVRLAGLSLVRATEAVGSNDDLLLDNFRLRQPSVGLQVRSSDTGSISSFRE